MHLINIRDTCTSQVALNLLVHLYSILYAVVVNFPMLFLCRRYIEDLWRIPVSRRPIQDITAVCKRYNYKCPEGNIGQVWAGKGGSS